MSVEMFFCIYILSERQKKSRDDFTVDKYFVFYGAFFTVVSSLYYANDFLLKKKSWFSDVIFNEIGLGAMFTKH